MRIRHAAASDMVHSAASSSASQSSSTGRPILQRLPTSTPPLHESSFICSVPTTFEMPSPLTPLCLPHHDSMVSESNTTGSHAPSM